MQNRIINSCRIVGRVSLLYRACLLSAFILALTGCEELKGPSSDNGLFSARLQDCKPGYIPPCDNFGPGDIPAIIFGHNNGRTITVRVYNIHNGAIVWNNTEYIPRDSTTNWWSLKTLPGGEYKAELLAGNTLLQSYNFNIVKASARKR